MSSLQDTPRSDRIHIVLVGRRNAGKSSLINALTGHRTAIVSDVAGTTTDPVYKSMEIHGLGPCVLVDTAGFDDEGGLGALRLEKTADALDKADRLVQDGGLGGGPRLRPGCGRDRYRGHAGHPPLRHLSAGQGGGRQGDGHLRHLPPRHGGAAQPPGG